ncbi:proteoglycan 4 isoform X1 [Nasonia vitripennis]|uniref:THAP-type domain-containing protein n=2 Tax=Nasonia vitripennis TaxID=7425 RepID=A0A7M7GEN9_NASVI|nr:proteoglycan 4 isoform X1 [Nasonia vitripennis]
MPSCCLEGCESYKFLNRQTIGYYKFPFDNIPLLEKWLSQIRIPNWVPEDHHRICSTHFHVDDIDFSDIEPRLKENAVPVIFPLKHFQNIYVDELASVKGGQNKKCSPKDLKKKAIACKKKMNLIDSKHTSGEGQKSMVLLCAPTEQLHKNPRIQINTESQTNLRMKNIPLKSNKALQPGLNPYILIVSENAESKIPFTKPQKSKQVLLKIQIEKKINDIPSDFVLENSARENKNNNQSNVTNEENTTVNNSLDEIEIDDVTSTKRVIFKFDPSTGEIIVQKRDKLTNNIVDVHEKKSNPKKINSSPKKKAKENNENVVSPLQEPVRNQEEIRNEEDNESSCKTPNSKNGVTDSQENITKETESSTGTTELQKPTKEQQIPNSTVGPQKPLVKESQVSTQSVESNKPAKETQISTSATELQKTSKKPTKEPQTSTSTVEVQKPREELQTSTPTTDSQKTVKKVVIEPQTSTPNKELQKLAKEPQTSTSGVFKKSTKTPTIQLKTLNPTIELRKTSVRLTKEPQTPTTTVELKTPAKRSQTSTRSVESKTPAKRLAKEPQSSTPTVESKIPAANVVIQRQTLTPTVESKTQAKKLANEPQTSTPTVVSKTPAKKLVKEPQPSSTIVTSKTPAKKVSVQPQTSTPVVSLQRATNKPAQVQNTSTIKKDTNTKTVNNKQTAKVKADDLQKKRKSDVIVINTSEDEDEEQSSKDNKKVKTNSNTVILDDQAVITIIE